MKKAYFLLICCMILIKLQAQNDEVDPKEFSYGGFPVSNNISSSQGILPNIGFVSGYSEDLRNPLWVCYKLKNQKRRDTCFTGPRRNSFLIDTRTQSRVKHADYTHSGYDRGHMAPNAAILCWFGKTAQRETYFMTNVTPQLPELNQQIWEELEAKIRKELSKDDSLKRKGYDLYITTGPIFTSSNPDTLNSGVVIPDSFYKIIVFKKGRWAASKAIAVIMPQIPHSDILEEYIQKVDTIEELTGLDFFPELSNWRQKRIESRKRKFDLKLIPE